MNEFSVVFEVTKEGFTEWRFALPGLLFLAIGIGLWKVPVFSRLFEMKKDFALKFGKFFAGFAAFWVIGAFSLTYYIHVGLVDDYNSNNFELIEGIVESYEKDTGMGNIEKGYKLGSIKLWHGNMPMGPEFTQPALKDIKLEEGMLMRVAVSGSLFMKVEIANQKSVIDAKSAQHN